MTEKTYSQMRRDYYEAYRTKIVPAVQKFEKERKTKLAFAICSSTALSILGLFFAYCTFYAMSNGEKVDGIAKLTVIIFSLAWFSWYWIKKGFENKIKERIMPYVTACYENLEWVNGVYRTDNLFRDANLVGNYNDEEYDDIFTGSYHNVPFSIVEAEYSRRGSKSSVTIFDGVIIKFDMNKNFTGNTVVKEKQLISLLPDIQDNKLKKTTLEDVEFNKKYNVYTDDEVEARYLLTPSFMERMKKIQVAFSADRMDFSFYDQYLLVALHTRKDLFSICSLVKPVDDAKQYFTMYEEIISIIKLIDHFKLNQKIGL